MAATNRRELRSACTLAGLFALILAAFLPPLAQAAQGAAAASLHGTILDSQGKAVEGASVQLQRNESTEILTAQTDARGSYLFAVLRNGAYTLKATKAGYAGVEVSSVFLAQKEAKTLDLTLGPSKSPDSAASSTAPQFFDQPQFTVAGVTDTTSLGGHGSDTVVRTRESLAKETATLGKSSVKPSPNANLERSLRDAAESQPQSFEANHRLGRFLIEGGRAREATPYLENAAKAIPSDYENSYDLAFAYDAVGNYERARDQAQGLLVHHDQADLHHLLADVEEKLGDSLEALRQYQRAADLDPSDSNMFDWGSELLLHHAPEPAIEVFTKGNRLFPRSERLLVGLGAAWFAKGSDAEAVQRICEASDLNPNDPIPYLFLGRMQSAERAPSDQVVDKLHRFVALQPQNAEANYYYAVALWKVRKDSHDSALRSQIESLLNTSIGLDPKYAPANLQMGILHAEEGEYVAAVADYQRALQADAQTGEAHYRLAQAYRQLRQPDKAKEELRLYEQIEKESAQRLERERHEIRQFVYTLRDQPAPQVR